MISMVVGLAAPSALALDVDGGTEIHEACRQAGFSEAVCTCIVREAHSRFTHDQMHVLAVVIPDLSRITDDPDIVGLSGETAPLSETQLAHLHQRAVGADIVIQRACGIGLTLDSGR
ncbi:hypothetical protein [Maricaulis sp.]|uniref:hypothetical protein n=1 Tax=Maricaulis sp. TaxID=1486257 RepID=UPI002B264A63|nr:hypothetical protein [Maricaulis sp.]